MSCSIVNGSTLSTKPVSTGVLQGCVLGSLIFLIYINDLNKSFYHFANDTNMPQSYNSLNNLSKSMNVTFNIYLKLHALI